MKFLSWLSAILIIAAIIAAFTVPGEQDFTEFISKEKGGDTMACKPVIGKTKEVKILAIKILSFHSVSYCTVNPVSGLKELLLKRNASITDSTGKKQVNIGLINVTDSETYLGLFGRFWNL